MMAKQQRGFYSMEKQQKKPLLQRIEVLLYLLPFLISIGLFTLWPVINVFVNSFLEKFNLATGKFQGVGLGNFTEIFSDPIFYSALKNSFIYMFTVVPISLIFALLFASLLSKKVKGRGFFQTAYFLPMVTSVTAVGLVWKWMYNFDSGIFNYILSLFHIQPINWLNDPNYALPSLIIYGIWSILPFTIILLLAGLQNIDETYYTAAKVDGASSWKIFKKITLPLLSPTIGLVLVINIINTSKVCGELFPLFNGKPGPAGSLYTIVYYIFEKFQSSYDLGVASAAAIILFFIVLAFTIIQRLIQKRIVK